MSHPTDLFSWRYVWVNGPIIISTGPSGLATIASLKEHGVPFVIIERADCIASLWQWHTYDHLKLHLPKQFCELPLLPFPKHCLQYPSKQQFIDYLESYTKNFNIYPLFNQTMQSTSFDEACGLWRVKTVGLASSDDRIATEVEYMGQWLVTATRENAEKVVPEIEGILDFGGSISHMCDYKSGEEYTGKRVLVVNCGNSGMVVRESVHVLPREVFGKLTFGLAASMMKWLPMWLVDRIILILSWLVLVDLDKYGLKRPFAGPLELKNTQGRTPVLDIGALGKIKAGEIKVVPGVRRFLPGKVSLLMAESLTSTLLSWPLDTAATFLHGCRDSVAGILLQFATSDQADKAVAKQNDERN